MNFYLLKWAKSVILCEKKRDSFFTFHCKFFFFNFSFSMREGIFFGGFPFSHVGREEIVFPFSFSTVTLVSFILYLFFNANLLNVCEQSKRKTIVIEFVDDVNVLTYNTSTEKNCRFFEKLHEVFTTWFRRHKAIFFLTKFELIHLNKN